MTVNIIDEMKKPAFAAEDASRFYEWLNHYPTEWTEIRAIDPNTNQVETVFVNSKEAFLQKCGEWSGTRHVYAGVNPRTKQSGKAEDVARVTGIPFDVDPPKIERNQSATANEKKVAYDRLQDILRYVHKREFGKPYVDDSGNGYRLSFKVNLSITDHEETTAKLREFFNEFKKEFPYLDNISDLPRIIKVPGTWSLKGENTAERPHRQSKLIQLGDLTPNEELQRHILGLTIESETSLHTDKTMPATLKLNEKKMLKLRPCFQKFLKVGGRFTLKGDRPSETRMRQQLVKEMMAAGYGKQEVLSACMLFDDYDEEKSRQEVKAVYNEIIEKGESHWTCKSIHKHGGCLGSECSLYAKKIGNIEQKKAEEHGYIKLPLERYGFTIKKMGKNYVAFKLNSEDPVYTFKSLTSGTVKKELAKLTDAPFEVVQKTFAALHVAAATQELNVPERKPKEELAIETYREAQQILEQQDPFQYLVETVTLIHAGDEEACQIEWISALSAKLTKTKINAWTIGGSGKGKTHLKYSIIQTLPNELYEVFTSASPLSLFYYVKENGEDSLDGVLLYIDEVEASKFALPMLRSLTSQTEITPRHLSVHEAEILDLKIKGSRSVWFTSVKTFGSEQIKNRFIHINPDETIEQDDRVFSLQDQRHREEADVSKETFNVCKAIAQIIIQETADIKVSIPFKFSWPFKKRRFLYPIFLAFIKIIVKVHFKQRETDKENRLVATIEDFMLAKKLWRTFERSIMYRVSNSALNVLDNLSDSPENAKTHSEISETLPVSTRWVRNLCDELLNEGLVNSRKRSKEGAGRLAWEYWKAELPTVENINILDEVAWWRSYLEDEAVEFQHRITELWKSRLKNNLRDNIYFFTATSEIPKLKKRHSEVELLPKSFGEKLINIKQWIIHNKDSEGLVLISRLNKKIEEYKLNPDEIVEKLKDEGSVVSGPEWGKLRVL